MRGCANSSPFSPGLIHFIANLVNFSRNDLLRPGFMPIALIIRLFILGIRWLCCLASATHKPDESSPLLVEGCDPNRSSTTVSVS